MTVDDIPAGLALCRASRWNQIARDWEQFLKLEPHGAAVAVRDGQVIGSVATLRFGARFGWISMVLVDPAQRRRGVGRVLLLHGLSILEDVVARLDATPAGEVLYRTLAFEEEYRLTRFQREPAPFDTGSAGVPVPAISDADWSSILSLDADVFGADRSAMLTWLLEGAPEYGLLSRSSGTVDGFVLGRHGHDFDQLGPVVAKDGDVARQLVSACLARHADRRFVLDAPDRHASWHSWLRDAGFAVQRPFVRMYRGRHQYPGDPSRLFATIGPEFG
jgi:GNAT superfamily N-acetyltransferase